jgi:hypothetical protein
MSDLIYSVDCDTKDRNYFKYTQDQRRKATKQKKYRNILFGLKKEQIEGKTIIEWETLLSDLNRKSLTIDNFSKYVKLKNNVNGKLFGFYENYLFRKLKLISYINMLKSEQKLINQFKRTFGNPEEVVIGIGDFEQRKHRKFKNQ